MIDTKSRSCGGAEADTFRDGNDPSRDPFPDPAAEFSSRLCPVRQGKYAHPIRTDTDSACNSTREMRILKRPAQADRYFPQEVYREKHVLRPGHCHSDAGCHCSPDGRSSFVAREYDSTCDSEGNCHE